MLSITSIGDAAIEVSDFGLEEGFSPAVLAAADESMLRVEDGCVVIVAVNGTWTYQVCGVTEHLIKTRLLRYER